MASDEKMSYVNSIKYSFYLQKLRDEEKKNEFHFVTNCAGRLHVCYSDGATKRMDIVCSFNVRENQTVTFVVR